MPDKFVSFPCIIEAVASRRDKTIKITIGTQELPPNESGVLLALANQQGYCYLSPNALKDEELVVPAAQDDLMTKTPSQRLRAVLFVLWKQKGSKGDFTTYYAQSLEKVIESIKGQLEPE